jgi:aryl-alcohol dehydrogenase-like predicted oxidoreductase
MEALGAYLYLGGCSYRSPADFEADDIRKTLPRFSEENFPKNLEVVDKIRAIADKYNATTTQVTLAWILAEHPDCAFLPPLNVYGGC